MFNEANIIQIVIADYKLGKFSGFIVACGSKETPTCKYISSCLKQILQIILASHDFEIKSVKNLQTHEKSSSNPPTFCAKLLKTGTKLLHLVMMGREVVDDDDDDDNVEYGG